MIQTGLDPKSREARAHRIAKALSAAWKAEAREYGLKSTLPEYRRAIVIKSVSAELVVVALAPSTIAHIIEHGWGPVDLRQFLLSEAHRKPGSSQIKYDKQGRPYRSIMFRRKTAEIRRHGFKGAYSEAKQLSATTSDQYSGRLIYGSSMPSGRARHLVNQSGVVNVSDFLAGMRRLEGVYSSAAAGNQGTRSTYAVWRMVSYKRPEAWQYPRREPANLAHKVAAQVDQIIEGAGI